MTPAPAVPMTAGEQKWTERELWLMAEAMDNASSYHEGMRRPARESVLAWLNDGISDSGHVVADQLFTEAPPAPQPVSGQALEGWQLKDALGAEGLEIVPMPPLEMGDSIGRATDRAAARLAAPQGVAFDARALRIALVAEFPTLAEWGARIEETIRRHTPSVAAGREVVEVTTEDVEQGMMAAGWGPTSATVDRVRAMAAEINARLRARAGTAGPQWVKRPESQAGDIVVPETGWYFMKWQNDAEWCVSPSWKDGNYKMDSTVAAIRHYDPETCTTGPVIERTATAGGWTAETVPQVGEAGVLYRADGTVIDDGSVVFVKGGAELAELWNRQHTEVAAYVKVPATIPPVEAQP